MPAYLNKAASLIYGRSLLGYRAAAVLWGVGTVLLAYLFALRWGRPAARWAALLLAFNEYHMAAASEVMEIGPYLFFNLLAIYAMARYLDSERPG